LLARQAANPAGRQPRYPGRTHKAGSRQKPAGKPGGNPIQGALFQSGNPPGRTRAAETKSAAR